MEEQDGAASTIARLERLLAAERTGRAKAERALRAAINGRLFSGSDAKGYACYPIGTVVSAFKQRRGAPRQGLLAPAVRAQIKLLPSIPPSSLEGLDGYSHVFLLWIFHENTLTVPNVADEDIAESREASNSSAPWIGRPFAGRVAAPGLYGDRTGAFATRTPHRPNAIGMSLVKLDSVDPRSRTVYVSGCDLIAETPIIDIKPAAPYDCASCLSRLAKGDGDGKNDHFRCPEWVSSPLTTSSASRLDVRFTEEAQTATIAAVNDGTCLPLYRPGEGEAVLRAIEQVLALDIRSVYRGRGGGGGGASMSDNAAMNYEMYFSGLHVLLSIGPADGNEREVAHVISIEKDTSKAEGGHEDGTN